MCVRWRVLFVVRCKMFVICVLSCIVLVRCVRRFFNIRCGVFIAYCVVCDMCLLSCVACYVLFLAVLMVVRNIYVVLVCCVLDVGVCVARCFF